MVFDVVGLGVCLYFNCEFVACGVAFVACVCVRVFTPLQFIWFTFFSSNKNIVNGKFWSLAVFIPVIHFIYNTHC